MIYGSLGAERTYCVDHHFFTRSVDLGEECTKPASSALCGGLYGRLRLGAFLFHVDGFSLISIIGGILGSFVGLFIAYNLIKNY